MCLAYRQVSVHGAMVSTAGLHPASPGSIPQVSETFGLFFIHWRKSNTKTVMQMKEKETNFMHS